MEDTFYSDRLASGFGVEVVEQLADDGGQAVVFACTEIELLLGAEESPSPAIDSTYAHAMAAVDAALAPD